MIKLNVRHTKILASNLEALIAGNINSILVSFVFSSEWNNLARVAVFRNGDTTVAVSLTSDTCAIPWEVLESPGELVVSLRGLGDGGNYVLCTENEFLGRIASSTASAGSVAAEDATPDVIDTLLADVSELKAGGVGSGTAGKSAYEIAVDNGFVGSKADWLNSLKGADGADGHTPVKGLDYWTDADRLALANDILSMLPVYNGEVDTCQM